MSQKIAIAATTNDYTDQASSRFARCDCFAVYDRGSKTYAFYDNPAKDEASGAGNKAAKILSDLDVNVVLVPEVGPKAYDTLHAFDIDVFKYDKGMSVKDALYAFFECELTQVHEPSQGGKHK